MSLDSKCYEKQVLQLYCEMNQRNAKLNIVAGRAEELFQ